MNLFSYQLTIKKELLRNLSLKGVEKTDEYLFLLLKCLDKFQKNETETFIRFFHFQKNKYNTEPLLHTMENSEIVIVDYIFNEENLNTLIDNENYKLKPYNTEDIVNLMIEYLLERTIDNGKYIEMFNLIKGNQSIYWTFNWTFDFTSDENVFYDYMLGNIKRVIRDRVNRFRCNLKGFLYNNILSDKAKIKIRLSTYIYEEFLEAIDKYNNLVKVINRSIYSRRGDLKYLYVDEVLSNSIVFINNEIDKDLKEIEFNHKNAFLGNSTIKRLTLKEKRISKILDKELYSNQILKSFSKQFIVNRDAYEKLLLQVDLINKEKFKNRHSLKNNNKIKVGRFINVALKKAILQLNKDISKIEMFIKANELSIEYNDLNSLLNEDKCDLDSSFKEEKEEIKDDLDSLFEEDKETKEEDKEDIDSSFVEEKEEIKDVFNSLKEKIVERVINSLLEEEETKEENNEDLSYLFEEDKDDLDSLFEEDKETKEEDKDDLDSLFEEDKETKEEDKDDLDSLFEEEEIKEEDKQIDLDKLYNSLEKEEMKIKDNAISNYMDLMKLDQDKIFKDSVELFKKSREDAHNVIYYLNESIVIDDNNEVKFDEYYLKKFLQKLKDNEGNSYWSYKIRKLLSLLLKQSK